MHGGNLDWSISSSLTKKLQLAHDRPELAKVAVQIVSSLTPEDVELKQRLNRVYNDLGRKSEKARSFNQFVNALIKEATGQPNVLLLQIRARLASRSMELSAFQKKSDKPVSDSLELRVKVDESLAQATTQLSSFMRDHEISMSMRVKIASLAKVIIDMARSELVIVQATFESSPQKRMKISIDGLLLNKVSEDATIIATMRREVDEFIIGSAPEPQILIVKNLP